MQSVSISFKVVSSNPADGRVYSIHHYVIKWWFSTDTPVPSINKTDSHDITEILLKVVLNTITPLPRPLLYIKTGCQFLCFWYLFQV